jgi:hypothetical protein
MPISKLFNVGRIVPVALLISISTQFGGCTTTTARASSVRLPVLASVVPDPAPKQRPRAGEDARAVLLREIARAEANERRLIQAQGSYLRILNTYR